jgi:2-iminobutanoate/2-iminopropanoate deaminase
MKYKRYTSPTILSMPPIATHEHWPSRVCKYKEKEMNAHHNIGVATQIGTYSDAVEVPQGARWLMTAGTPGLATDGTLPEGIAAQAELAWQHIVALLEQADMSVHDVVKITQYLLHESDIAEYARIRSRHLKDARPASMLLIVPALVRPGFLVEIEVVAARS